MVKSWKTVRISSSSTVDEFIGVVRVSDHPHPRNAGGLDIATYRIQNPDLFKSVRLENI